MNWLAFRLYTAGIAAVTLFLLSGLIYVKKGNKKSWNFFALSTFFLSIWALGDFAIILADDKKTALFYDRLVYVSVAPIVLYFFYFCSYLFLFMLKMVLTMRQLRQIVVPMLFLWRLKVVRLRRFTGLMGEI